jgi:AsmA protein
MRTFLKLVAGLTAALLAVVLALPFLIDADRFRPLLEQKLSQAIGRAVTFGQLRVALWDGGVAASTLIIAEDPAFGGTPFVTATALKVGVDMRALLLHQELHVRTVTLDDAVISLKQTEAGEWNFSSLGATKASESTPTALATPPSESSDELDVTVQAIQVRRARVVLRRGESTQEFRNVNIEVHDVAPLKSLPFSFSGDVGTGSVVLAGAAGPLADGHAVETPFDTKVEIKAVDFGSGQLSFNGQATSNGQTASLNGAVTIDKLKLSERGAVATRPVGMNLALAHDLKTRRGNIGRSTVKLGTATAVISGSYSLAGDSPTVQAALAGPNMPLQELLAFLPVFDVVLPTGAVIEGGMLTLGLAARGTLAKLATSGSVKIEKAKLTGYDLGTKLRLVQELAGLPTASVTDIELAGASFDAGLYGTRVRKIQFVAPALGQVTGEGTVSPAHDLDFKMSAVVKTGGLLAVALRQRGDTTTVPFFIRGTSADPVFKADAKSVANEKLQQVLKNPEGAVKNAREIVDTAKGLIDLFRKKK